MKNTIVLIHGMFQNPKSWENWVPVLEAQGYDVLTPAWPLHEGDPATLRSNPPNGLGKLELDTIITSLETFIYGLPDKPIVIGHSVGGLIAQLLVARDIAKIGVAICSVAPNAMVTFDWSFFKNAATIANPLKGDDPVYMDIETFKGAFANTLSESEVIAAFEKTATHDSRNVFRDCMSSSAKIDTDLPHAPLLFISASEDKICPAELNQKNYEAYTDKTSSTAIREFPSRSHYICNEPGWEEVVDVIVNWLATQTNNSTTDDNTFQNKMEQ
ncbi:MAG: alpha/beta hydrolase [Pedobacter sp.]|nr:MAG: alpha/beta hydrolase [Pedobacter sp.]